MTDAAGTPFDDIRRLIATMPGPDEDAVEAVRARDRQLTKPAGSLGRLEWLPEWVAAWQGKSPSVDRPHGLRFRRQPRRRGAGRLGIPPRGQPPDAGEFRRRRRRHQPDLRRSRPRLQGLRPRHRHADQRHRRGGRHGREILRRHHGVRDGIARRRHGPPGGRRDWASATPPSRRPSTRRSMAATRPIGSGAARVSTTRA